MRKLSRNNNPEPDSIGARLKAARESIGLSQTAFAAKIGIAKSSISEYEAGKKKPPKRILTLVSLLFGLNDEWLLTGEGEMKSSQKDHHYVCSDSISESPGQSAVVKGEWKVSDALVMATRVLESRTDYADALYASIASFHRALQTESTLSAVRKREYSSGDGSSRFGTGKTSGTGSPAFRQHDKSSSDLRIDSSGRTSIIRVQDRQTSALPRASHPERRDHLEKNPGDR
jgi:transcriptional regulator with XRE-family HTH domain